MSIFDQPTKSAYDPGPTPTDIDADLADASISLLERYAAQLDTAAFQARSWEALPLDQRKAIRAGNELAKRQNAKARAAAKAAEDARVEAAQQARIDAQIADYKTKARAAWLGDQASFDSAWPDILRQWQIDQARATMDAAHAAVRARLTGF
jgi:hypothetical protein